ncbi:Rho termination factor N-terminal domain-containing protein [Paenibacillus sp. chi10]|uniref:Rho termination factor N-terminal domain-containing protein n=1 Tax=Paenibacillus suaedae TaxID=3077233 RepID=A0AAJ2K3P5_9BACL|nr:Rho termination factor N-terminal domain-containing protein [Paenibacillus sp. chi10]MDT8979985.1 Rho termination factor N-terminal domain-containing protein [Paenibacillus sp. chi10]
MVHITYRGENSSLNLYGIRFEPGKPQLVVDLELINQFNRHDDFTVEEVAEVASEVSTPVEAQSFGYEEEAELTLTALKEQAKAASIKGYSTMNKQELIEALEAQSKADFYADAPTS